MTKYSQFPSDEELETLLEEEPVYSVYWDSESLGAGADLEQVYRWGDKYIVCLSSDENTTVYSSLLESIESNDLFNVGEATKEIDSSALSSDEIASHLSNTSDSFKTLYHRSCIELVFWSLFKLPLAFEPTTN